MFKKLLLTASAFLLFSVNAFAATYYASSSGGGAASCVDNGANVCTLARAVAVSATGTNTILCTAGTYDVGSAIVLNSTNAAGNITIQSASGTNDVNLASTGGFYIFQISATMKSGSLTLDGLNLVDNDATRLVYNAAPEVNVTIKNGTYTNTESTKGYIVEYAEDTTNRIAQTTSTGVYTGLKTGATTNVKIAQKITVGGSNIVTNRVALYLKRYGTSSPATSGWDYRTADTLTVTIETDSAGAPSGTPITNGTSNTRLAYDVNPNGGWYYFDFASNAAPVASTGYWIVLTASYTASSTNYIGWEVNTSGAYAGGDSATYNGTTWTASAASVDYSFAINRNHTRDLTIQNITATHIKEAIITDWVRNVSITNSTFTRSGSASNNWFTASATESGNPLNSLDVYGNTINMSTAGTASIIYDNTHGTEVGWTNKVAFYNNTITTAGVWFDLRRYLKNFMVKNNTFTTTYTGNTPFNLGSEVDGVDPQEIENYPFDQIVIEGNTFYYTGSTHNHMIRPGVGADNGVLRNNKFIATGAVNSSGNWGIILKAGGWFIDHNLFHGPGPGIYVCTKNNRITNNTIETNGGNSSILFYPHQDVIYGGDTGLPKNNYVSDNIFQSTGSYPAIQHCDISGCSSGSPTFGIGRTEEYWSNVIDNNIYYRTDGSYVYQISANTNVSSFTTSNTIADVQAIWQNTSYTNSVSLSSYNDRGSGTTISNPGIDGSVGVLDWTPSITGTGSVSGSNIGAYSVTGSLSGGAFGMPRMGSLQ